MIPKLFRYKLEVVREIELLAENEKDAASKLDIILEGIECEFTSIKTVKLIHSVPMNKKTKKMREAEGF